MPDSWPHEDVVEALYAGILKRAADLPGLEAHVGYLTDNPTRDALTHLVSTFVGSDEFKVRLAEPHFTPIKNSMAGVAKIESAPIHHVMSVGASCSTSAILQRWWLRREAGPFDWMFSSMGLVRHVLEDDFQAFLDPAHMEPATVGERKATRHHVYAPLADTLAGHEGAPIFLHHDLIEDDRAHFARAAERTRHMLRQRTLMVGIYQDLPGNESRFNELAEYLTRAAPRTRLMAFVVRPTLGALMPDMNLLKAHDHHRLYRLCSVGVIGETGFANIYDEMAAMRAIHQFNFDLRPVQ